MKKVLVLSVIVLLSACSEKEPSKPGPLVVDFEITPEAFQEAEKLYEKTLEENRSLLNADLKKALTSLERKLYHNAMSAAQSGAGKSADVRVKGMADLIQARAFSLDKKCALAKRKYGQAFGKLGVQVEPKMIILLSYVANREGITSGPNE